MADNRIGAIRLTGADAINFANNLFRPTKEAIDNHNEYLRQLSEDITLSETNHGFAAEIESLDLTFLDDVRSEEQLNFQVPFVVKIENETYSNTTNGSSGRISYSSDKSELLCNTEYTDTLIWAA